VAALAIVRRPEVVTVWVTDCDQTLARMRAL
jgi:hypothetical protein